MRQQLLEKAIEQTVIELKNAMSYLASNKEPSFTIRIDMMDRIHDILKILEAPYSNSPSRTEITK